MGYELYGSDMSDPQARDDLVSIISSLRRIGSDFMDDKLQGFDTYSNWAKLDPDSYKDFVIYCSEHADVEARRFIAHRCDYLIETDAKFTFGIFSKLLRDDTEEVRFGASENIEEAVAGLDCDEEDRVLLDLGLSGLSSFLKLLHEVVEEKKQKFEPYKD